MLYFKNVQAQEVAAQFCGSLQKHLKSWGVGGVSKGVTGSTEITICASGWCVFAFLFTWPVGELLR